MRKIQHYPNDAFEFHKKAVSRKKASQEKTILQSVEKDIEDCYTEYNDQKNRYPPCSHSSQRNKRKKL